eukprot:TRINITY_DN415_c0_g1_i2.p1 TRINITY_DN415_c0_g1~~TRINITY_DN415_c0_g1_i2.p1  ORF type:complete len:185 (-),score=18.42 TRINITY_DN415_c0_g1_i2:28-582(-)
MSKAVGPKEKKLIEDYIAQNGDKLVWSGYGEFGLSDKPELNKKAKLSKVIIASSQYRIYVYVKKALGGYARDKEYHMLSFKEFGGDSNMIWIKIEQTDAERREPPVYFLMKSGDQAEFLKYVREAYNQITVGWPDEMKAVVTAEGSQLLSLETSGMEHRDFSPGPVFYRNKEKTPMDVQVLILH